MPAETVKIYCYDQQVVPVLVDGVLIRVYDEAGVVFQTQDYTGSVIPGAVEFTLTGTPDPSPTVYTIRMSKLGVAFDGVLGDKSKSPQKISIYSPPLTTNDFDVYGNVISQPVSSNPYLCRCGCRVFNQDTTAADDALAIVQSEYVPIGVSAAAGSLMVTGRQSQIKATTYSGEAGWIIVDLLREGIYWVTVEGLSDEPRRIHVPDRDGFDLVKLMFPIVERVVYTPSSLSLAVGETSVVTPVVTASDTRVLTGTAQDDVEYTSSDPTVAQVSVTETVLNITAIASGSATISASAKDTSITFLPAAVITQTPITVTVA